MRYCARYHTVASILPVLLILCLRTVLGMTSNLIPMNSSFTAVHKTDLLNGVTVLKSEAIAAGIDQKNNSVSSKVQPFTAIPYYARAHRGKGENMIWFRQTIFQQ